MSPEVKNLNATHSQEESGTDAPRNEAENVEDRGATVSAPTPVNLATPELIDLQRALVDVGLMTTNQWSEAVSTVGKSADLKTFLAYLTKVNSTRPLPTEDSTPVLTKFQAQTLLDGNARKLWFQHYLILDRLGKGGMGEVLKALNTNLYRIEAVKMIKPQSNTGPLETAARRRFKREAEILAALDHPYITKVWNAGFQDDLVFIAMEYVRGQDVEAIVREHRKNDEPIEIKWAIEVVIKVAEALHHAHERGVYHRDVKPSNIMITDDRIGLKVLDLGIGRLRTDISETSDHATLTQQGGPLGTPAFMPPEQWYDATTVTAASDIYSLGITLFYMIAGQLPYKGRNVMFQHMNDPPPRLRKFRPDAPKALESILLKMLAKSPEQRYSTSLELIEALAPLIAEKKAERNIPWRQIVQGVVAAGILIGAGGGVMVVTPIVYDKLFVTAEQRRLDELTQLITAATMPSAEHLIERAELYEHFEEFAKAAEDYKDALALDLNPTLKADVSFKYGLALLKLDNRAEALKQFQTVVEIAPRPEANLQLARLQLEGKNFEAAAEAAVAAMDSLEGEPRKEAQVLGVKAFEGWIGQLAGAMQYEKVVQEYERAQRIGLDPDSDPLKQNVAQAYLAESRRFRMEMEPAKALDLLKKSLGLNPTVDGHLTAGELCVELADSNVDALVDAVVHFSKALELPTMQSDVVVKAHALRAEVYKRQGDYAAAIADYEQLRAKDPSKSNGYVKELAQCHLQYANKLFEADSLSVQDLKKVVVQFEAYRELVEAADPEADRKFAQAYLQLGRTYREGDGPKLADAKDAFERSLKLHETDEAKTELADTLANLADRANDFDQAIELFERSLKLKNSPTVVQRLTDVHLRKADQLAKDERFDLAVADLSSFRKQHADAPALQRKQAEILVRWSQSLPAGQVQDCIEKLKQAKDLDPQPTTHELLGDAYKLDRQFARAVESYNVARDTAPKDHAPALNEKIGQVYAQVGMGHFERKEYRQAIEQFEKAAPLSAGLAKTYSPKLAEAYIALARDEKNVDLYDKALTHAADDQKSSIAAEAAQARLAIARKLVDDNKAEEALAQLDRVDKLDPNLGESHFLRGRLAADPDAAVVEFTAAIQRNFDRAEVYWARAEAYKGLKDKRIQMVQDYKRAAEKVPQQDPNWKTYTERRNKVIEEAIKEGVPYTDDPVELQKIARQATSDDKVRLAALCYDAMLGVQPRIDDPELQKAIATAFVKDAELYAADDNPTDAIKRYEQALRFDPKAADVALTLSRLYVEQGRPPADAEAVLRNALTQAPDSAEIKRSLAGLLAEKIGPATQDPDKALKVYSESIALAPSATAHAARAKLYLGQKKLDLAGADLASAKLLPLTGELKSSLASLEGDIATAKAMMALDAGDDPDAIIDATKKAMSLQPENATVLNNVLTHAHLSKASRLKKAGDLDGAIQALRVARQDVKSDEIVNQLRLFYEERAQASATAKNFKQAVEDYTALIADFPDKQAHYQFERGKVRRQAAEPFELALADFDAAGKSSEFAEQALKAAASLLIEEGDRKKQDLVAARKLYEDAYKRLPDQDEQKKIAGRKLAEVLVESAKSKPDLDAKVQLLKEAAGYDADGADKYLTQVGRLYKDAAAEVAAQERTVESFREANRLLQKALDFLPSETKELKREIGENHKNAGVALGREKEYDEAEKEFAAALELAEFLPKELLSQCYESRGSARFSNREFEEADKDYSEALATDAGNINALKYRALLRRVYLKTSADAANDYVQLLEAAPEQVDTLSLRWLIQFLSAGPSATRNGSLAVKYGKTLVERTTKAQNAERANDLGLLASAYAEAGDKDSAVAKMDEAIELVPDSEKPAYQRLRDFYSQGNKPAEPK